MKRIKLLFALCFSMLTIAKAQFPPNAFNYSAVARNNAGQPIATTIIGVQITILKSSATGSIQYIENHFVNTDAVGFFNIVIGAGAVQSGSMISIEWSNDNYYLKVGMDVLGGTNFLTIGTTQFLSVPYALYAKTADNIGSSASGVNFTHFIGEQYGGGIIFYLWKDSIGYEHGLIADKVDLSPAQMWSNIDLYEVGPLAQNSWDGLNNTSAIASQIGHTSSAAALCLNSTNGGQNDWYLPSVNELSLLLHNRFIVNKTLASIGVYQISILNNYWSSTEATSGHAIVFFEGIYSTNPKSVNRAVRAIRRF
jgi:hypothetical protein